MALPLRFIDFAVAGAALTALATASTSTSTSNVRVELVDGAVEISGLELLDRVASEWTGRVRVSVHDDVNPETERPPIVGSYEISGPTLRFHPMFPFEPGMSYRVSIDGAEPALTVLRIPSRDLQPTTIVTAVYPSSDVLPENQLKIYVRFSAPMSGGDGLEHVKLLDENDAEVVDPFLPLGEHFWDQDRRRYTIFFDPGRVKRGILPNEQMGRPIENGKRYRLVMDADWRDAEGLPLAARFEKAFRAGPADETPLDTASWAFTAPPAGTRDALVVDFPEPLDHEILGRGLAIEMEDAEIPGAVEVSAGETRWSFVPTDPWRSGSYNLLAFGVLEDLAGNRIGRPFEVDVFDRIDRPNEQEIYRLPFEIAPRER